MKKEYKLVLENLQPKREFKTLTEPKVSIMNVVLFVIALLVIRYISHHLSIDWHS